MKMPLFRSTFAATIVAFVAFALAALPTVAMADTACTVTVTKFNQAYLGTPWRMPTYDEIQALIDNCTTTWITNGVHGRLVTGTGAYANRSIFLPAAGYGIDTNLYGVGSYGYYWSSTPSSNTMGALDLYLGLDGFGQCLALSIRMARAGGAMI